MSEIERQTSPDGRFEAIFRLSERMNGQWAATPTLRDLRDDATILALTDERLDGSVTWSEVPGRFSLTLRRWPGVTTGVTAHFDVDRGTVTLGDAGAPQPLAEAASLIDAHFDREEPAGATAASPSPPQPETAGTLKAWAEGAAVALFLLAGLAVMAGWFG